MQQVNQVTTQISTNIRKRMSFSRKLALTFFLITLITFVIIDCIMHVIYDKIITEVDFVGTTNIQAFNEFSNQEILSSTNAYLYTGLDVYEEIISQLYGSFIYFQQNPHIFVSNEQRGVNPPLTQTFTQPRYDRSGVFFLDQNSTFFNQPYLDQTLSSMATALYPPLLKRINIFYQNPDNSEDIMVRTVPATNQFIIPNSTVVTDRMETSIQGSIIITNWYYDLLSTNTSEQDELISLRFLLPNATDGFNILFEVEIQRNIIQISLENVYSFPSTNIILIKSLSQNQQSPDGSPLRYQILGETHSLSSSIDLQDYFDPGHYLLDINGEQILLTTSYPANDNKVFTNESRRLLSDSSPSKRLLHGDYTLLDQSLISMISINTTETAHPNNMYVEFLQKEREALISMLYGWTFIVLAFTCSIGLVIGHYLFSYFSLILKKCKMYISHPEKFKEIHLEMKKLSSNEKRNRLLMENIIQIMRRIENKKALNRKKPVKETDEFPLNLLNMDFQNRMQLRDAMRFEAIEDQLAYNIDNPPQPQENK